MLSCTILHHQNLQAKRKGHGGFSRSREEGEERGSRKDEDENGKKIEAERNGGSVK